MPLPSPPFSFNALHLSCEADNSKTKRSTILVKVNHLFIYCIFNDAVSSSSYIADVAKLRFASRIRLLWTPVPLAKKKEKFWKELVPYFPWYDTGHIGNDESNNYSIIACVFVTAVTFLLSRCLATIGEFLSSRCLATIGGFLPIRCLSMIGVIHRYTHTHTHTEQRDLISLLYFFKIGK
jgi:hypothetical protein